MRHPLAIVLGLTVTVFAWAQESPKSEVNRSPTTMQVWLSSRCSKNASTQLTSTRLKILQEVQGQINVIS
jgi:hypothetical protein